MNTTCTCSQGVDWAGADGQHGDDAEAEDFGDVHRPIEVDGAEVPADIDFGEIDNQLQGVAAMLSPSNAALRAALLENYTWLFNNDGLRWIRAIRPPRPS